MRKKILLMVLGVVLILVIIGALKLPGFISFPGRIKSNKYEPLDEGVKSTFEGGVVYRYPSIIPLLSVSGNHYEMGLQYGVLLKPEIIYSLGSYKKLLQYIAKAEGAPYPLFIAVLKKRAKRMAKILPKRFREEIRGIADGSGVKEVLLFTPGTRILIFSKCLGN